MVRNSIRFIVLSLLLTIVSNVFIKPCLADVSQGDRQAVITAVVQDLSFPGMPPDANPRVQHLAIVEDYAIADWLMADGGGQEILHQSNGHWTVLTGGGGSMDTPELIQAGVPESIASQLIQQIQSQWKH
jgi:hypothetical protein